jgi:hypothetical protein
MRIYEPRYLKSFLPVNTVVDTRLFKSKLMVICTFLRNSTSWIESDVIHMRCRSRDAVSLSSLKM